MFLNFFHFVTKPKTAGRKDGSGFQESEIGGNGGVFPQDRSDCREADRSVGFGGFNNHNMSSKQNRCLFAVCTELYGTQLFRDLSMIYHDLSRHEPISVSWNVISWAVLGCFGA